MFPTKRTSVVQGRVFWWVKVQSRTPDIPRGRTNVFNPIGILWKSVPLASGDKPSPNTFFFRAEWMGPWSSRNESVRSYIAVTVSLSRQSCKTFQTNCTTKDNIHSQTKPLPKNGRSEEDEIWITWFHFLSYEYYFKDINPTIMPSAMCI